MRSTTRKRLYIDKPVQGSLARRAVGYWLLALVLASLVLLTVAVIRERGGNPFRLYGSIVSQYWFAAAATFAALPLVMYDVIARSNRFVGPVYRLRRAMRALTAGEQTVPLQFREDDHWRELADEFNALAQYVDELKEQSNTANRSSPEFQDAACE